jgi:hypothetical protein
MMMLLMALLIAVVSCKNANCDCSFCCCFDSYYYHRHHWTRNIPMAVTRNYYCVANEELPQQLPLMPPRPTDDHRLAAAAAVVVVVDDDDASVFDDWYYYWVHLHSC